MELKLNIFERMSKICEKNKSNYDGTKFLLLLKIINKFFTKNVHDDINNPSKFIFFNNNSSELKLDSDNLQSKNISLLNGFTFGIRNSSQSFKEDALRILRAVRR